ncbi:MAG: hypothetical protein RSF33_08100 [Hydrogenoanaerobacterium sp.]
MALCEKISLLAIKNSGFAPQEMNWCEAKKLWASAEPQSKNTLPAKNGVSAAAVKFTVYKCELTVENAILWRGGHYAVTEIKGVGKSYIEVTAARLAPFNCTALRTESAADELKRPIKQLCKLCSFPAYLLEKWQGYVQEKPMATTEEIFILVAPKAAELRAGDLVRLARGAEQKEEAYTVRVCHTLEAYKNEYEIARKADV